MPAIRGPTPPEVGALLTRGAGVEAPVAGAGGAEAGGGGGGDAMETVYFIGDKPTEDSEKYKSKGRETLLQY